MVFDAKREARRGMLSLRTPRVLIAHFNGASRVKKNCISGKGFF